MNSNTPVLAESPESLHREISSISRWGSAVNEIASKKFMLINIDNPNEVQLAVHYLLYQRYGDKLNEMLSEVLSNDLKQ